MLAKNLIQIAGIHDKAEADLVLRAGARYLGFPLRLDFNPEDISEADASTIIKSLRAPDYGVLITYLTKAEEVLRLAHYLGARIVQLHGNVPLDEIRLIKENDPGLQIIKSLVVGLYDDAKLLSLVGQYSAIVDAFITDTYDPESGSCGATGMVHDWRVSQQIVELSPLPVILAGGLNADNVKQAILEVRPYGVDSHTGVEAEDGRKSFNEVSRFVNETSEGFRMTASSP